MKHLKLTLLLLPLLTILCFSQRSTDTEYHLVKFVDKTPYIIITSPGILSDVLKSIHSVKFYPRQFEQDPQLFSYSLDTTWMQWLLDSSGNIVQHIVGRRHVRFIGKTDLNRDGIHELTVQHSIGDYSGGIEVLTLENIGTKHPILQSKTSLELWWD